MLRKCTDEDISDEECEKVIDPFYDNYDSYLEEYVIPEDITAGEYYYFVKISVDGVVACESNVASVTVC